MTDTPPTQAQKVAVALAFVAAGLSLAAAAMAMVRTSTIQATPLFGGLFMLALALGGLAKIRQRRG